MTEQEKKERIKEQNRKAVKKYREKTVSFAVKYSAVDVMEGKRIKEYLEHTGKSANAFIKEAVREKLDTIGWMTDIDMDTDQEHTEDRSS